MKKILSLMPGLIISIFVMFLSTLSAKVIPLVGGATLAIFIGILLGNTVFKNKIFNDGTKFTASKLLEFAIVTLGGTLTFKAIIQLEIRGLIFIVLQMILTIIICIYIGRKFNFSRKMSLLLASGNAVCGASAIAATSPVIDANDEEKSNAIMLVNVMGTILMIALPIISLLLYNHDTLKTSAFIGGTLQSIGQVVASGLMVNLDVGELATIFKIVRVVFLIFVVIGIGMYTNRDVKINNLKLTKIVPWYIIGFFILCLFSSLNYITNKQTFVLEEATSYFQTIALAAIGLRINFKQIIDSGSKLLLYGAIIMIFQVLIAILLILILF